MLVDERGSSKVVLERRGDGLLCCAGRRCIDVQYHFI